MSTSSLCGNGNLPRVASVALTHDTCSLKGHGQNYRMHGPQVPRETTAITLVSDMCCVELHCHTEGSHLMPVVKVSSCKQPHTVITSGFIRHSHLLLCHNAWIWCGWHLCIPEHRCHNFSSRLTHFKLFVSQRIWVLPLHFNLFCLRSDLVQPCLTACHCGFQELMSFFKPLKMWNNNLKMLIFVFFHQTSGCVQS